MIYIDSDKLRIYEVPSVAHTVEILPDGLRRYTPDVAAPDLVEIDLLAEIYSPWVLHRADSDGDHAFLAFRRSGGAVTGEDENGKNNAPTNLFFRNDYGWRIILANYPHEFRILGNLRREDNSLSLYDFSPLNVLGAFPTIERSSDLIVRTVNVSGTPGADITAIVDAVTAHAEKYWTGNEQKTATTYTRTDKDTGEVLVHKNYENENGIETLIEP